MGSYSIAFSLNADIDSLESMQLSEAEKEVPYWYWKASSEPRIPTIVSFHFSVRFSHFLVFVLNCGTWYQSTLNGAYIFFFVIAPCHIL